MREIFHLWSLPYVRWHIFIVIIPSLLIWFTQYRYLIRYKKTFLLVTVGCFLWGLPLDILSVPIFHVYSYQPVRALGINFLGLPLEEYFFLLLVPQEATATILLTRKKLYG